MKNSSGIKKKTPVKGVNRKLPHVVCEPVIPDYVYYWEKRKDPKTPAEIKKFFASEEIEILKRRMCDMGRRMWERQFTDGNGGNLTIRVGGNLVLCTPTLISKGFMTSEDICLVDMEGRQLAGVRRRTSEVLTHIAIMKRQIKARACCHAHPPHATAFAVARLRPPTCLIPEAEIFLGEIGMAKYDTPGSPETAQIVGKEAVDHQCVLMENHGVITWGKDIEDVYWKMENVDAYCRTVWIAASLGKPLGTITMPQTRELIGIRKALGMDDRREKLPDDKLCDNSYFKPGFC
jgi:L-fuculose-phosphate aldolase